MGWFQRTFRSRRRTARDVDAAFRGALRRVLEDDLAGAEELLARVVAGDSEQTEAYLALARLYRRRGETGRAIRIHQNLLLRTDLPAPLRDEALLGLAGDFRTGGFLQRAIAAYEEVLERRPRDAAALRPLIRLHADVREHARAIELSRRLARVEGRDGRAEEARLLVESAAAAHAEGRHDEARRSLKKAVRRDARCVQAWIDFGALEAERGRTRQALAAWRRVPELDRRRGAEVYPRLEATFAALGRAREFESYLRELLEDRPGDTEARLALVRTLAARGEAEEALAEARAALESEPENLKTRAAVARLLVSAGREPELRKEMEELLDALEGRGVLDRWERLE